MLAFVNLVFQFSMVRLNSWYIILCCFLLAILNFLLKCSPCRSQAFSFRTVDSNPMSSQYSKQLPSSSTHLLIFSYLQRMLSGHLSQMNSAKITLLSISSHSSVNRAPARCSGGHGFDSCRGLRIFLSHARVMLNISSFTFNYRAQNSPSSFTYHHS